MYNFVNLRTKPWMIPKWCFENSVDVEFENNLYKAPVGYDEYLKTRYGNYMSLPPEAERYTHIIPAYWIDGKAVVSNA